MEEHKKARRRADAQRAPLADDRFRVDVDDGDRSSKLPPSPSGPVEISTPTPASAAVVEPYSGASTVRLPEPASPVALPANDQRGSESAEPVSLGAESAAARPAKPSDEDRKLRGIIRYLEIERSTLRGRYFVRGVMPRLEGGDARLADVEAEDVMLLAGKCGGKRQADIAKADDCDLFIGHVRNLPPATAMLNRFARNDRATGWRRRRLPNLGGGVP